EDISIHGARGILINITGSGNLRLQEVNEASMIIQQAAHEEANIIFGAVLDEGMKDQLKITVIATGFRTEQVGPRKKIDTAALAAVANAPVKAPVQWNMAPRGDARVSQSVPIDSNDLDVPAFMRRKVEGQPR